MDIQLITLTETSLAQHDNDMTIEKFKTFCFHCQHEYLSIVNRNGGVNDLMYKKAPERNLKIILDFSFDHRTLEAADFCIAQDHNLFLKLSA